MAGATGTADARGGHRALVQPSLWPEVASADGGDGDGDQSQAGDAGGVGGGDASVLLRVTAPHFVAGVVLLAGETAYRCAPILGYMRGWDSGRIRAYVRRKGWHLEEITGDSA